MVELRILGLLYYCYYCIIQLQSKYVLVGNTHFR